MLQSCVASYPLEVLHLKPKFGYYFRILHSATDQAMTGALASMDLTAAQGHIIGFIAHQSTPPCAHDIEVAFRLSHPTVSGLLSRLEKKGFLEFRPDARDRRCKRIFLLPKAWELLEAVRTTMDFMEDRLVQGFTEEEQAQFAALLRRAIQNVGACNCRKPKEEPENHD